PPADDARPTMQSSSILWPGTGSSVSAMLKLETAQSTLKAQLWERLEEARARTYQLLAPVSDADLLKQHNVLMSPLVWDLGHIGNFEELWLVQPLANAKPTNPQYDDMYDAFEHPRRTRARLPLLD